jgi:hypothetical protein
MITRFKFSPETKRIQQVCDKILINPENLIRETRNGLLADTDWTQTPDNALTQAQRDAWATYRQALRDITNTYNNSTVITQADFENIVWPTPPA